MIVSTPRTTLNMSNAWMESRGFENDFAMANAIFDPKVPSLTFDLMPRLGLLSISNLLGIADRPDDKVRYLCSYKFGPTTHRGNLIQLTKAYGTIDFIPGRRGGLAYGIDFLRKPWDGEEKFPSSQACYGSIESAVENLLGFTPYLPQEEVSLQRGIQTVWCLLDNDHDWLDGCTYDGNPKDGQWECTWVSAKFLDRLNLPVAIEDNTLKAWVRRDEYIEGSSHVVDPPIAVESSGCLQLIDLKTALIGDMHVGD